MPRLGALTVAVMDVPLVSLGATKFAGVVIAKFVLPAVNGWNVVFTKVLSPLKITGLVTMVPTAELELVTVTFTVIPVRTF